MRHSWEIVTRVQSEGDAHPQEDACGFAGPDAWIIDGATTLLEPLGLPAATDPQWLAQALTTALARVGTGEMSGSLSARDRLAAALRRIDAVAQPLVGGERLRFPSAAVSLAHLDDDGLQIASLADCRVLVRDQEGAVTVVLAEQADRRVDEALDGQDPDPEERLRLLRRDRELRNTEGNLWVARREPEAAQHADLVRLPRPALVALVSDGAWRAVDLGLVGSAEDFLRRVGTPVEALELLTELRREQARIGEVADDATVLVLRPAALD
ncbi:protein phosphatase 2C domain-containing protein [Arthrobacter woluwensis]|uniref:protein phosphatase 2C domain-containing protein n=1 Tax=Arthrobacter woluwensis TaxID=156980 RepID=UPI001AAFFBBB|nr:protein phosphatase 2C domain-containing protein [Arthrobacter woluwensis]QTF70914.1 hypothetical protein G8758_01985 [Arthrobacter woluwensis]